MTDNVSRNVSREEFDALKERVDALAKAILDDLEWRVNAGAAIDYGHFHSRILGEVRGVVEAADVSG